MGCRARSSLSFGRFHLGPAWALLPRTGVPQPAPPRAVPSRGSPSIGTESFIVPGVGQLFPTWLSRCSSTFIKKFFFDSSCHVYHTLNVHMYVGLFLDFLIPLYVFMH